MQFDLDKVNHNSFCVCISHSLMSLVESKAAFEQRCDELTTDGSLKTAFAAAGIDSFSKLAFSVGTPQSPPTEAQFDGLARLVFGAGVTVGQTANIKRLHFESTTLIIASLKERVASEDAEGVSIRKIPPAEKRARQENQEGRLTGVCIQGELAPSHQLLDLANHIYESGAIIWVAPSKCTKRDDEVQLAVKPRAPTVQVENSQLKVSMSQSEFAADSGSELKFQWCLQRRGIAYDQCYLLSWSVHEQLVSMLLGCLSRTPSPGFQHVKLEQLVRADRELWTILARETKGSLKTNAAGVIPLDARVTALLSDPRVTMMLLPVPASHKAPADKDPAVKKTGDLDNPKKKRKTRAEKACPEELKKYDMKLDNGRICWSYNLKDGCSGKTSGKPPKCSRGIHVCANCKKPGHSVLVCRALQNA